jgi:pilus assembly protein CpaE
MSKEQEFVSAGDAERPAPPMVRAFLRAKDSEAVISQCLAALGIKDMQFTTGNLAAAAESLAKESSPKLLILDVSGIEDPLFELRAIADVCDPSVAVIAIGDRNDIGFYREMKNAGISDYFTFPIQRDLLASACKAMLFPDGFTGDRRTGELVYVLGVRGGVGATSIATSLAWSLAENKRRHTVLVDLGLQTGDAALQLDAVPNHALCDALGHPERVDKLLLERGLKHITNRLSLFASLEPLDSEAIISEESFLWLLSKLLPSYRLTIVEVPAGVAMKMIWALKIPSTCLLISNASLAGARDLARWSEMIGPDTPERHTLHIVNHVAPHGGLKDADFARASGRSPDLTMAYSRELAEAAPLGIKAMQKGASFKRNLAPLLSEFTGETQAKKGSLLSRFFKVSREPRDQAKTADSIAVPSKARVKPVFISK